jgi:hypothetical protein
MIDGHTYDVYMSYMWYIIITHGYNTYGHTYGYSTYGIHTYYDGYGGKSG